MRTYFTILLYTFFTAQVYSQKSIGVPSEYASIQEALNAAIEFDTILVSPGTYYENIIWPKGKNLHLLGINGSEETILNGRNLGRVLDLSELTKESFLKGFTIQNGNLNADYEGGAGLRIVESGMDLSDLIIKNNQITGNGWGAGSYLRNYSGLIDSCQFNDNIDRSGLSTGGAGLFLWPDEDCVFTSCTFRGNHATGDEDKKGSGLNIWTSTVNVVPILILIQNSTFADNTLMGSRCSGGGLEADGTVGPLNLRIESCDFIANSSTLKGGAISVKDNVNTIISNSFFTENTAQRGSALNLDRIFPPLRASQFVSNCKLNNNGNDQTGSLIYANIGNNFNLLNSEVSHNRGAILAEISDTTNTNIFTFQNCTLAYNEDPLMLSSARLNISESILWNNGAVEISEVNNLGLLEINIDNSIIKGGSPGENVIDLDPLFISEDNLIPTENSPCINAGVPAFVFNTDLLGNPRPMPAGTNPDLGCYEVDQEIVSSIHQSEVLDQVKVYPNPASHRLHFSEVIDRVQLWNNLGQLVKSSTLTTSLDVKDLPAGNYTTLLSINGNFKKENIMIVH